MRFDYCFEHASVIDGTAREAFEGTVGVAGDTIELVQPGEVDTIVSRKRIDATGLVLCPGFIDIHAHSELEVLRNPPMESKIGQGITTEVSGNCGIGVFPVERDASMLYELVRDVLGPYDGDFGWKDFPAYVRQFEKLGSGTNMAFLQSHSALRCAAIEGNPNRPATEKEVETMCRLLAFSFESGCAGFSSGLYYAPCLFADRRELLALLETTSRYGRFFAVHIRCEGDDVLKALGEVLDLARIASVRLEISHLKAIGRENQILVPRMLSLIEDARSLGVDVHFDQYPYVYGSTSLFSLLPPQYLRLSREDLRQVLSGRKERAAIRAMMEEPEGWDSLVALCGWDNITAIVLDANRQYEGKTMTEIAGLRGQGPFDAFFDLLEQERGSALMMDITQSQGSVKRILSHPLMCFGTDALYVGEACHPRSYQAAIHLLDRYWRRRHVLPLEQIICKMTGEPASRIPLFDRGRIEKGYKADLVLFDPRIIEDVSTAENPKAPAKGLSMVMVNGKLAFSDGACTKARAGRVLSVTRTG